MGAGRRTLEEAEQIAALEAASRRHAACLVWVFAQRGRKEEEQGEKHESARLELTAG